MYVDVNWKGTIRTVNVISKERLLDQLKAERITPRCGFEWSTTHQGFEYWPNRRLCSSDRLYLLTILKAAIREGLD